MINAHLISLQHGNAGLGQISSPLQRKLTFKVDFEELFEIFYEQKNKATWYFSPVKFQSLQSHIALDIFRSPIAIRVEKVFYHCIMNSIWSKKYSVTAIEKKGYGYIFSGLR